MNLPVTFSGIVQKHLGRGKKLGFPTANIEAPKDVKDATYLGYTYVDKKKYPSIVFVGVSETFGEIDRWAEAYLLDFSEDLYGQEIAIEIVQKLRENFKFATSDELIAQMRGDETEARKFFNSSSSRTCLPVRRRDTGSSIT